MLQFTGPGRYKNPDNTEKPIVRDSDCQDSAWRSELKLACIGVQPGLKTPIHQMLLRQGPAQTGIIAVMRAHGSRFKIITKDKKAVIISAREVVRADWTVSSAIALTVFMI